MPVMMNMQWDGVTAEQYDQVRKLVDWEGKIADGGLFHIAAFGPNGMRVTDLWETADHFNRFVEKRLMPVVQELRIPGQPRVEILPAHAIFSPAYKRI